MGRLSGERLTRWNLATGNLTRPPRLSFAERVDNNALVAFGSRKNLPAPDTVAPLDPAAGWGPWTARGDILAAAVSPDRQLIATIEDKTKARVVRILRLTTGKAIQKYRASSYPGFSGSLLVWENDQHVLVYGFHPQTETRAVLRLSTTGTAERISPFRRQAREIVPVSEP